jgi:hypothetical protein
MVILVLARVQIPELSAAKKVANATLEKFGTSALQSLVAGQSRGWSGGERG